MKTRLDILSKEIVRERVRHFHSSQDLTDEETDKIIEEDAKFTEELRKFGYTVTLEELAKRGIKLKPIEKPPY